MLDATVTIILYQLSDADKKMLDELLPLLTVISDCDSADPAVREMADDLKVAVATRGLVWAEISKLRSRRTTGGNRVSIMLGFCDVKVQQNTVWMGYMVERSKVDIYNVK